MVDEKHIVRLHPEAREMLDKSIEERISYIRQDRWIPYPEADRILAKLEAFYNMPEKDRAPSMLLVGDSNCGKSSLVRHFLRLHPPTDGVYEAACPVYYLESCPPEPDEGRLYEEILQDILIPFRYSDKPSMKMAEIEYQFELMGVRVIILDEIHNAMSGSALKQRTFLNAIKNLHNAMKRSIVLVGTQEAQFVMTSDTQFASRFKMEPLKRWDEDVEFQKFLVKLELTLPLAEASLLASPDMSKSIYKRAESGCIGDFVELVVEAAIMAINNGKKRITNKEIKECDFIPSSKKPPSEKLSE